MATGLTLTPAADAALRGSDPRATDPKAAARFNKVKDTAQDFEAMFIHSMFQQMFANVGQGPFSGGPGAKVWQSFLTDEYSKSFVKSGGIGLAADVQRELLARQEMARQ
jgi:Rod binding domain-containing protein